MEMAGRLANRSSQERHRQPTYALRATVGNLREIGERRLVDQNSAIWNQVAVCRAELTRFDLAHERARAGRSRPAPDLRAEEVRLLLVVAAVAEQQRAETELGAFRDVPAQLAADDRSCAITPPTSASSAAASNMRRCTNIGPPGSANALMSFRFTGVNEYRRPIASVPSAPRRLPICVRCFAMCWSSMMGYCLRTSDAASFPSCTSCFGVYFVFGSLITVCADRLAVSFCRTGAEIYQSPHSHRSATLGSTAAARRAGR